nr:hypothetical protein [Tanacetum cinerariifolium]
MNRELLPKIEDKDNFELKGQFLKELCDNTFSDSDHKYANEHIEKVLEIVDLFHTPNMNIDQVMLRAFPMSLTGAASRWLRNKPYGSITTWEDLKAKFLSKYCSPARTAKKIEEINNFQKKENEKIGSLKTRLSKLVIKDFKDRYEVLERERTLKALCKKEEIIDHYATSPRSSSILSVVRRMVLATAVYYLWRERNSRLFTREVNDDNVILKIIVESIWTQMACLKLKKNNNVKKVVELWNVEMNYGEHSFEEQQRAVQYSYCKTVLTEPEDQTTALQPHSSGVEIQEPHARSSRYIHDESSRKEIIDHYATNPRSSSIWSVVRRMIIVESIRTQMACLKLKKNNNVEKVVELWNVEMNYGEHSFEEQQRAVLVETIMEQLA